MRLTSLTGSEPLGSPRDPARPELSDLRKFSIRGFEEHLVFYRPTEGGVEIVRVLLGMNSDLWHTGCRLD